MIDTEIEAKLPACFGELDTVFPKGEDGLRNTPKTCLACLHKTRCLRSAMEGDKGLKVQEGFIDRAYASGLLSFVERWSQKKALQYRLKALDTERKAQKK